MKRMKQLLAVAEAAYGTGYRVPGTSALPGMRRSAVTDAVGLAPSLHPRLGAVAITVTTAALNRASEVWTCGV